MKFVKMTLMGIGGVALAVLLLTPKTAHALVAALVQVTNTTANPVPNLDTERNARIPYQSSLALSPGFGLGTLFIDLTPVPTGYRLVAQNVSATLYLTTGAAAPFSYLTDTSGNIVLGLPGGLGPVFPTLYRLGGFNNQVTAYFDAGDTPQVFTTADFQVSRPQSVTLTGYLENCAITGCPTIQK